MIQEGGQKTGIRDVLTVTIGIQVRRRMAVGAQKNVLSGEESSANQSQPVSRLLTVHILCGGFHDLVYSCFAKIKCTRLFGVSQVFLRF